MKKKEHLLVAPSTISSRLVTCSGVCVMWYSSEICANWLGTADTYYSAEVCASQLQCATEHLLVLVQSMQGRKAALMFLRSVSIRCSLQSFAVMNVLNHMFTRCGHDHIICRY